MKTNYLINPNESSYLVSNIDIEKKFKHDDIDIIIYSHLNDYEYLLELLNKSICAVFILLKTSENSGHWTVIVKYNENIYYFDSYGVKPDGELKFINSSMRSELNENNNILTKLIHGIPSSYNFTYNKVQFQSHENNINTCGKWTTVFTKCIFHGLTLSDFITRMKQLKQQYDISYDNLVDILWDAF